MRKTLPKHSNYQQRIDDVAYNEGMMLVDETDLLNVHLGLHIRFRR